MKQPETSPLMIAVSGVKNSGKTTILEQLIMILTQRGLNIAVIKHDGHLFEPDVSGTDSYRHRKAGAYGTAVFCEGRFMLIKEASISETEIASMYPEANLILLEGFKDSVYPKIEVIRKGNSDKSVCRKESVLAYASDCMLPADGIPVMGLDDYEGLAELIYQCYVQFSLMDPLQQIMHT